MIQKLAHLCLKPVALRKESVDRNSQLLQESILPYVALRKESVDRNGWCCFRLRRLCGSLSARRAWIEISGVDFAEDWLNGRSPQGERG